MADTRKKIKAEEFTLTNEAGETIATLEATGLDTPVLHLFTSLGLSPH